MSVPKKSFGIEYKNPGWSLARLSRLLALAVNVIGSSDVKSVADVHSKLQVGYTAVYFKLARRPWNTEIVVYSKRKWAVRLGTMWNDCKLVS